MREAFLIQVIFFLLLGSCCPYFHCLCGFVTMTKAEVKGTPFFLDLVSLLLYRPWWRAPVWQAWTQWGAREDPAWCWRVGKRRKCDHMCPDYVLQWHLYTSEAFHIISHIFVRLIFVHVRVQEKSHTVSRCHPVCAAQAVLLVIQKNCERKKITELPEGGDLIKSWRN